MWRSVPSRSAKSATAEVDEELGKAKPLRTDDSTWVRKGYVLTIVTLALFLLSGFWMQVGQFAVGRSSPDILSYVTAFNTDGLDLHLDVETDETVSQVLDNSLKSKRVSSIEEPRQKGCNEKLAKLKVFMYDLRPEFHYGMISEYFPGANRIWPRNVSDIPRYPGGLYQQHSPEYWLTTDLVTSDMPDRLSDCTAFRVKRWQDADLVFVPFFASLSYNKYSRVGVAGVKKVLDRNMLLQKKLVSFLKVQPAWRASNGTDHVVVIHHPNSMVLMREQLRNAMFVVADFGRYEHHVANIVKDVVAPYKHVIPTFEEDVDAASSFKQRTTLLFFQGALVRKEGGIIRQQLYQLLQSERDVVFATGSTASAGIRSATAGMRSSKFCLHLAGDTPSSNRLFDAVASHCVPVVISDDIELPFEAVLDYSKFCIFVNSTDALRSGFVIKLLNSIGLKEWSKMHGQMSQVQRHFRYQHPTQLGDAVHMTWDAIASKVPALTLARNKRHRYARSHLIRNHSSKNVH